MLSTTKMWGIHINRESFLVGQADAEIHNYNEGDMQYNGSVMGTGFCLKGISTEPNQDMQGVLKENFQKIMTPYL